MERTLTVPVAMTSQDTEADNSIVERYLAGDMTAFDELMIRYERLVYRVCYRFVNNRDDAMDLAQEVFIKAFEHLAKFPARVQYEDLALSYCDEPLHQSREEERARIRRDQGKHRQYARVGPL